MLLQDNVFRDNRGAFTETWEHHAFEQAGLDFKPHSTCFSFNAAPGTLRGMHYQTKPFDQAKIVTCVAGKIYDVILDLRKDSPTFLEWQAIELIAFQGQGIYIPKGCAHGFVTLTAEAVVSYLIEGDFNAEAASVVRWNDPRFKIEWPVAKPIVSVKDSNAGDYADE